MDIDNMHPFCLPFSLCHDATTSTTNDCEDGANNSAPKITAPDSSSSSASSATSDSCSSGLSLTSELSLSSSNGAGADQHFDELLDSVLDNNEHQHSSLSSTCNHHQHSLLGPDDTVGLIGSAYSALQLDIGLTDETQIDPTLCSFGAFDSAQTGTDENEPDTKLVDDDWFPSTDYSSGLLSPDECKQSHEHNVFHQNHHHYHNHHHHHHQQVVIDPLLDAGNAAIIKSSPTLAQLNLNSNNDDPTEGLWGAPDPATTIGRNSKQNQIGHSQQHNNNNHHHQQQQQQHQQQHQQQQQQLGLCTSTLIAAPIKLASSWASTHALQRAAAQQRLQHATAASDLQTSEYLLAQHHNQTHQQQHHQQLTTTTSTTGTCLQHAHMQAHNNNGQNNSQMGAKQFQFNNNSANNNNNNNDDDDESNNDSASQQRILSCTCQQRAMQTIGNRSLEQRCASPALVSSSSSPTATNLPQQQQQTTTTGVRLAVAADSKLKENIDYLTALLCQGQQQQAAAAATAAQQPQSPAQISSSAVKSSSYATLAQTLATGPKLLERQPSTAGCNGPADGWYRRQATSGVPVESSVIAADSTAEANRRQHQATSAAASYQFDAHQQQAEQPVLSSLLSNNCAQSTANTTTTAYALNGAQQQRAWSMQHQSGCQMHHFSGATRDHQHADIPPHGRPITLTPLANNNSPIVQRQQQTLVAPAKPQVLSTGPKQSSKIFAQPQSPSASSTASSSTLSGLSNEIGSSSSVVCSGPIKRQRASAFGQDLVSNQTSNLANQHKSTHSLAGSLDEGFSSSASSAGQHADNDTINSPAMRDSDDDSDDVDSDDESFYGDYTNNDLIGASISDNAECKWTLNMGRTRRNGQKRFFWQYNVQSKGPKGARISSATNGAATSSTGANEMSTNANDDPFVLPEASDPVFSNDCQVEGVKHSGKARRGDGNDLTPNPRKLLMIGLELKKLSKIINELAPVTELPLTVRNKTRKEKNKLASRACRLKKKAQHEANKIKLYGLQREHAQVVAAIYDVRKLLAQSLAYNQQQSSSSTQPAQFMFKSANAANHNKEHQICIGQNLELKVRELIDECSMHVAGRSSDYVNSVLEKVVSGCIDGGLQT